MTTKFKSRYVLGEGYPWVDGLSSFTEVSMFETPFAQRENLVDLDWPEELWSKLDTLPKYRLVLERVE